MTFVMTSPARMTSQLLYAAATCEQNCSEHVLQQRQATDLVCFFIRLPRAGIYTFQVHQLMSFIRGGLSLVLNPTQPCPTRGLDYTGFIGCVDFQSSRRPPVAMCYCQGSVVCYCRLSTLEQSTCWRPVFLVTHNISSKVENSFISAILPRHCVTTTSP